MYKQSNPGLFCSVGAPSASSFRVDSGDSQGDGSLTPSDVIMLFDGTCDGVINVAVAE